MRYDIAHRQRVYTLVDDRTTVAAAAVTGRLVDETTARAVPIRGTLRVAQAGLRGRVVDGGWFTVSAVPAVDLPLLASQAYTVDAHVAVPGFVDRDLALSIAAGTALPLDVGDVVLRRRPVQVRGRVVHAVTGAPIAGARVFAAALTPGPHTLVLRPPLHSDRPAGTPVRHHPFGGAGAVTRTLAADAHAGDGLLMVDGPLPPEPLTDVEVDPAGDSELAAIGATTDSAGYYRLDGIGRVAEVRLVARAAGLTDDARTVVIDYRSSVTTVTFRLEP